MLRLPATVAAPLGPRVCASSHSRVVPLVEDAHALFSEVRRNHTALPACTHISVSHVTNLIARRRLVVGLADAAPPPAAWAQVMHFMSRRTPRLMSLRQAASALVVVATLAAAEPLKLKVVDHGSNERYHEQVSVRQEFTPRGGDGHEQTQLLNARGDCLGQARHAWIRWCGVRAKRACVGFKRWRDITRLHGLVG